MTRGENEQHEDYLDIAYSSSSVVYYFDILANSQYCMLLGF